jgi:hypothetical protein
MLCQLAIGTCAVLLTPIALVAGYFVVKKQIRSQDDANAAPLHRMQWENDVVYVVQFPSAPNVRTISPFALKLETWLRANKIPFKPVYSLKFSTVTRQIPYVELNGEEIGDSNIIIERLRKHFYVTIDADLSKRDMALTRAFTIMLENHTCVASFYWRYGHNMKEFAEKCVRGRMPDNVLWFWTKFQPFIQRFKTHWHGLGRHSDEEVHEFSCQDIQGHSTLPPEPHLVQQNSP